MLAIVVTVLCCLAASAFCSVTEASFYSVPPATVEFLQKNKKFTARYLTHVKENIDRYIASVLIVNTVANTVGASLATALAVKHAAEKTRDGLRPNASGIHQRPTAPPMQPSTAELIAKPALQAIDGAVSPKYGS